MKRNCVLTALLAGALAFPPLAAAQAPRPGEDPMAGLLFPPDLVLQHAQEVGLQSGQRTAILNAVKEAQGEMFDLQMKLGDRSQELQKLLNTERVDEAAVLAQIDRVLAVEREMKRKQMQLLVRIKNALGKEQQDKLRELQRTERQRPEQRPDLMPSPG